METFNVNKEQKKSREYISPTAKFVAYLRTFSELPFVDKIAQMTDAEQVYKKVSKEEPDSIIMGPMVEARFKAINKLIERFGNAGIVELSSGVSPRGLMMSENTEVNYIETDLPDMIQEKESIVHEVLGIGERENLNFKTLDVLDKQAFLEVFSGISAPVSIISEGLLLYLSVEEKEKMAENIKEVLSKNGGVWLATEMMNKKGLDKVAGQRRKSLDLLSEFTNTNIYENSFEDNGHALKTFQDLGFKVEKVKFADLDLDINSVKNLHLTQEDLDYSLLQSVWVMKLQQ